MVQIYEMWINIYSCFLVLGGLHESRGKGKFGHVIDESARVVHCPIICSYLSENCMQGC